MKAKEYFGNVVRSVKVRSKIEGGKYGEERFSDFPVYGSCIRGIRKADESFYMTEINRDKLVTIEYPYLVDVIAKDGYTEFELPARRSDNMGGFEIITPVVYVNNISELVTGQKGIFTLPVDVEVQ